MASAADYRPSMAAVLAFLSASVLFWFGNGLHPWWPLLWFAPLPLLLFASRSSWRGAALTTFFSLLAGSLNMWGYFHVLRAPPIAWAVTYSVAALGFTAAVLLFRALLIRRAWWSAWLAFPATWVCCEYAANLLTPHGTAGSLAYTQLNFLPLLQIASITGPWGVSFLLLLFPATLAVGWQARNAAPQRARWIVGTGMGVLLLALLFGAVRLALPLPGQRVKVGLIASDEPSNVYAADAGKATERLFRDYAAAVEGVAAKGAKVIVLPEKVGKVTDPDTGEADAIFQSMADKTQATIVVGLVHVAGRLKYNQARVYAPATRILRYDKHHMLPPMESELQPGTTLTVLPKAAGNWGVEICKDMDFTQLSRSYGKAGVGVMLVPGWDFVVDRSWHGHIALMRGVESGFSIVHAAKNGYLTASDSRGRILAQTESDSAPFATLTAEVPTEHQDTVYLAMGDWFAWVAMALLAFSLAQLYRFYKDAGERSATRDD